MAKHTFAYHNLSNGTDFFDSNFYNDPQIKAIVDPEGGNSTRLPTSIPSPFAVIDLVTTAFEKLAQMENLEGHKIYEKIVSQCWDIGVLFFNAKGLGERIQIIKWNTKEQVEALKDSSLDGHKLLGETLEMFLQDDASAYNFDQMKDVYMLKYNHNILGGTSPKTMFYCSLNPFEDNNENHINLGNDDILFDKEYCPLFRRPEDFQLFIYLSLIHI